MPNLLDIHRLTKYFRHQWTFRPIRALTELSLGVHEKEVFGLIGHNGAGKTTTFKLLLGLLRPTRGEVVFDGQPSRTVRARRQIGFLPEQPYFYDYLTVRELLDFYGQLCGLRGRERRTRIDELADRLHLAPKFDSPVRSLSKGTLQRVGVAQAIMHRPRLAILDEPMSGLDPIGRKEMRELIHCLKQEGTTVVFSSHILPDAEALCDRVGILVDGQLKEIVDLTGSASPHPAAFSLTVNVAQSAAIEALQRLANGSLTGGSSLWVLQLADRGQVQEALRIVHAHDGSIESLTPIAPSLEDRFLHYVQNTHAAD